MAQVSGFNKQGVGSGQVVDNAKISLSKPETKEFTKKVDFENKVSNAKNITIDLSVFLDEMKFDRTIDTLDEPSQTNNNQSQ